MKGTTDIIMTLHYLSITKQHLESFQRDMGGTALGRTMKLYLSKIEWILNDYFTNPVYSDNVRKLVKQELGEDSYSVPALTEKIGLLNAELREALENIIDKVLAGEELQITV